MAANNLANALNVMAEQQQAFVNQQNQLLQAIEARDQARALREQQAEAREQAKEQRELQAAAARAAGVGEDMAKNIANLRPDKYLGEEDPVKLENWIVDMEKVLDTVQCAPNLRVLGAVFYLRGPADLWWREVRNALMAQQNFGWDQFVEALRARFYPRHVKTRMQEEFLELTQGSMKVAEYHKKFLELSRFVGDLNPIDKFVISPWGPRDFPWGPT